MNQKLRWEPPVISTSQRLLTALAHSFPVVPIAAALSLLFMFLNTYLAAYPGENYFTRGAAINAIYFTVASWLLCFLISLLLSSRKWSDSTFTVSGLGATFFGLTILAVFFGQLAIEVTHWFQETPVLVHAKNEEIRERIDKLQEFKATQQASLAKQKAEIEKDRDFEIARAKTEEEKQEIRELAEDSLKRLKSDFEKTSAESAAIDAGSVRESNHGPSNFYAFLTNSASSAPQDAGIGPALWGSILLGLITVLFAVPVGVGAALYLEEYRQEGRLARLIQLNINNLAGVPSVVFGILGGFVFVYISSHLQRWDPSIAPRNLLGGGLTLGLLTLPVVIVSSQEAIRAVPNSLRQGAYALGATKWQVMWTIVLPMARPGIMTGTILALSRAIGEAAPLVLFGALQFVDQSPSLFSPFTALPMQIFEWSGRPGYTPPGSEDSVEIWKYNAALASTILLVVILTMNGFAIYLRNRAQRKMRY